MTADTLAGVPRLSSVGYADLHVGQRFGPFREPVSAQVAAELGGGLTALVTLRVLRRALEGIPAGGVLLGQRFAVHAEVQAPCDLDVDVRVATQERRGGHLLTGFVFRIQQDDDLVAVADWTIRA